MVVAVQDKGMTRVMAGVGATPSTTDSATAMLSSRRPSSISSSPISELHTRIMVESGGMMTTGIRDSDA